MPVQYGSIIEEHRTVRSAVGLFDLSHMGELYVEGPEAGAALAAALVSDPPSLAVGRAQYSMICAEDGGIIDDLIVYRLGETRFLVVANAGNAAIVSDALAERLAGVPGGPRRPVARDRAARRPGPGRGRRPRAADRRRPVRPPLLRRRPRRPSPGIPGLVARTGYTGEDGFEVFVDTAGTGAAVGRPAAGGARRRRAARSGSGARDTLRLEAGMPLYGNELDLATEPVRGRPRPGGQARQGRRLRRPGGAREGRPRRPGAAPGRPGRRGPRHRPPRLPGLVRRAADRRRDQRARSRRRWACRSRWPTSHPADAEPGTVVDIEIRDARVPARVVTLPFYRRDS